MQKILTKSSKLTSNLEKSFNFSAKNLSLSEFLANYTNESNISFAKLQDKMKAEHYKKLAAMCPQNLKELNPNIEQLFLMNSAGSDRVNKQRNAKTDKCLLDNKSNDKFGSQTGMKPPSPGKPLASASRLRRTRKGALVP